jgi:hypothetical protein
MNANSQGNYKKAREFRASKANPRSPIPQSPRHPCLSTDIKKTQTNEASEGVVQRSPHHNQ